MPSFFNGFYAFCFRFCKYETNKNYLLPFPVLPSALFPKRKLTYYCI